MIYVYDIRHISPKLLNTLSEVFTDQNMVMYAYQDIFYQITTIMTEDITDFILRISTGLNVRYYEHTDIATSPERFNKLNETYKAFALDVYNMIMRLTPLDDQITAYDKDDCAYILKQVTRTTLFLEIIR